MDDTTPTPIDLDTSTPNLARVSDYLLGGKDNFAADRRAAAELLAIAPEIKTMSEDYQAFHGRAVRYLAEQGIRQYINLTGALPTHRNTHEVAQSLIPDARVAYVADDPVVLCHARAILGRHPNTTVIEGDIRHPGQLLADPELRDLINPDEPIAVVVGGRLQYIPDTADPFGAVARLRDLLPAGSYLALTHVVFDLRPEAAKPVVDVYRHILSARAESDQDSDSGGRTREEVLRFFEGFDLVEPGLVYARRWRPENPLVAQAPCNAWITAGVGRKTGT